MAENWAQIIADLEGAGLTTYKIGAAVGLHHTQVERLKCGSEPKHSTGELLKALKDVLGANAPSCPTNSLDDGV